MLIIDCDCNCDQHNVNIPMKNENGWQFTAEVSHTSSRQFSWTEAHTHQSVSWDCEIWSRQLIAIYVYGIIKLKQ